ncbi:MAG: IS4 family transposase [Actinomycetota bacterium]|nr:IS4 family transposase [Actinomycetota bacterium]
MPLRIRHIDPDATPGCELSFEALARVLRPQIVSEVIEECAVRERRLRKLPASTVVLMCVAMNLYATDCLVHVFFRLVGGLRWLLADPGAWRVSKGALCQARYRLGARPLAALFRRVCAEPLAGPTTPGASLFGLRPVALDATTLEVADTPENVRAFGKPGASRGTSAWPQVRVVALSECATHAVLDAGVWRHDADERACGRRLLRGVGAGTLLLWDRGFHSFEMVKATLARGTHLLGRLPATVKPEVLRTLADGTRLVGLRPADEHRRAAGEHVSVRLIRYTLDDPNRPGHEIEHRLITSLLDPQDAPAEELVVAYHARWEFELAVDEIKSHQRPPQEPLRSKKPVGVIQEVYGLLVAHYVVRAVMAEAARAAQLAPTRLSFTGTLRVIREMIPEAQRTAAVDHPRLYRQLLADVAAAPLRPRANRSNPRVVKRKMSNFGVKRPHHRDWPQPSKLFREAVVLLN